MPSTRVEATGERRTTAERVARGKAERAEVPRAGHAAWEPPPGRRSPIDILQEQATTRVPELVPIRYGRMLVSAFTFFRGAAGIMAADLAGQPRTNLIAQLCGDAHLSNFGAYAAPDRSLVFDVNDFDETLPGPFEWDLKRLAASFAVAGRDRGFDAKQRAGITTLAARGYREAMREYAAMGLLDLWYSRVAVDDLIAEFAVAASKKQRRRAEQNLAKTRSKDSLRAFAKLTETVDGRLQIRSDPPVVVATRDLFAPEQAAELDEVVHQMLRSYRSTLSLQRQRLLEGFEYVDSARKIVGVGSVGTRAWIALLTGRTSADPLFLQFKQAEASVLEPYLADSEFENHGQRVVEGQRLTQAASDILLGWLRTTGPDGVERDYYVRQLWDAKGSALVDFMDVGTLGGYARVCGKTLARAHARSGDVEAIAGYLGGGDTFDRALATYAEAYADQNERDFAAMQAAVEDGTIEAEPGF